MFFVFEKQKSFIYFCNCFCNKEIIASIVNLSFGSCFQAPSMITLRSSETASIVSGRFPSEIKSAISHANLYFDFGNASPQIKTLTLLLQRNKYQQVFYNVFYLIFQVPYMQEFQFLL